MNRYAMFSPWRCSLALLLAATTSIAFGAGSTVLFEQPVIDPLTEHFLVPLAGPPPHHPPPLNNFGLLLWQPNPHRDDGLLVATSWKVGDKTGFYPRAPEKHQLGFTNRDGSTTVQAEGGVVGAYLNPRDLPSSSDFGKIMITPQYRWSPDTAPTPFSAPAQTVVVSLQLQVPTASDIHKSGSYAYVLADLQFTDPAGSKISYGATLFFNGHGDTKANIGFDEPSNNIMANSPVDTNSQWLSVMPGSATFTGTPWRGWRLFRYKITNSNFRAALAAIKQQYPASKASMEPADYRLTQFHLNAEINHANGPAELGWSMQKARISLEDEGRP